MIRAVTYARVSGDDRGRDGRNLAGQAEMCREYAQAKGYSIVAELAEDDRGASGASFDLPELNNIREMARKSEFDILVVRELDRLSRNLAKQLGVEEELKRCNVEIEYVLGEYPDTPEGNFMKHVRASVAEFEREKIKERMIRGRVLKAKAGKWTGNVLPYGFKRNGKGREAEMEIDLPEAEAVRKMFHWFKTEAVSLREIARRLTDDRIPIPGKDFNRPGWVWSSTTVRRILSNKSYIGIFKYGNQTIHLPHLAIISEDIFKQVQDKLNDNKRWQ
jgi:site-specific DNA recombinase